LLSTGTIVILLEEDSMRSSLLSGSAFALGGALLMWSCGGSTSTPAAPSTPTTQTPTSTNVIVNIGSSLTASAFNPNPVPASAGDSIAFKNNDTTIHHIVLDDGSADLGDLAPGATTRTITVKGAGNFHCTIHSSMVGAINGPIPDAPPCTAGPGYC
jgi:plastocyanin